MDATQPRSSFLAQLLHPKEPQLLGWSSVPDHPHAFHICTDDAELCRVLRESGVLCQGSGLNGFERKLNSWGFERVTDRRSTLHRSVSVICFSHKSNIVTAHADPEHLSILHRPSTAKASQPQRNDESDVQGVGEGGSGGQGSSEREEALKREYQRELQKKVDAADALLKLRGSHERVSDDGNEEAVVKGDEDRIIAGIEKMQGHHDSGSDLGSSSTSLSSHESEL
ncbi:hypothetical protein MNV49_005149 [Pseudohyphozyma bogoriensis]|nr:hypothetical protein MNV49_005149 [Pseudohyphozyma bogoriensis]